VILIAAVAVLAASCSGGGDAEGSGPTEASAVSSSAAAEDPTANSVPLDAFPVGVIRLGEATWRVAVAATADLRFRGLRGVADLGDLDGMLFVFPVPTTAAFTMRDTLIPIDIAFFDADGVLVDGLEMVPCGSEPCPTYRSSQAFRYALETEAGGFEGLDLVLDPGEW
jgi:uncharacterized membrane protein (UPF0127 family)